MQNTVPVLIVGAGPTGLTMALELNRYGIPVRIIDKQIKPVVHSNALAVQTRTLYAWDDMGLLPDAIAAGHKIKGLYLYSNQKKLARINLALLKGKMHFVLGLSQHKTEKMLIAHLREKNIVVEMEVSIVDLQEKANGTRVVLQNKEGNKEELDTQWLIACDGGHSFIREKLGIPFIGKELPQHFVLADAEVKTDLEKDEGQFFISAKGVFMFLPFDAKYSRIIAEVSRDPVLKDAKTLTYAQVKQLALEFCSKKLEISEPIWTSGFWVHENMIANYRHTNIFFAVDAAHIHSPAGGQGMNTGIQDAYNFAWKLALVVKGKAQETLLDTYQAERYPIGKIILQRTTFLTNIITTQNYFLRHVRNFIIFYISKLPFLQKKIVNTLSQLNIAYADSPLVKDCIPDQPGPRAGTFKADMPPELAEQIKGKAFVLLIFSGEEKNSNKITEFKTTFRYTEWIKLILVNNSEWDKTFEVKDKPILYLIRPDKYIGFRGGLEHTQELEKYFEFFIAKLS